MDDPKPATARIAVLAAMLFQNVAYTLLRRYSQGVLHENYSYAEVLVLAEVAKTAVAGAVACRGEANPLATLAALVRDSRQMLFLAIVYATMNLLSFAALRRVDASTFTVCAQLKILSTAGCSAVFLRRALSPAKWRSRVSDRRRDPRVALRARGGGAAEDAGDRRVAVVGLAAVLTELGLHSLLLYGAVIAVEGGGPPSFRGFSPAAGALVALGAAGGLLVALTLKYADAILKTLATAGGVVVSIALEALLGAPLSAGTALGAPSSSSPSSTTRDATPKPEDELEDLPPLLDAPTRDDNA
ncbi:pyrimidine nucleotide-sugar transmembrane transporter [Aureococcus anophagefferens]|nr:pyrimidine nucleotide-sugar transmembrane transporter [Aureococcus anophagefferens]